MQRQGYLRIALKCIQFYSVIQHNWVFVRHLTVNGEKMQLLAELYRGVKHYFGNCVLPSV